MGVARQASAAAAGRLVLQLQAQGQEKGEHAFDKRFAITQELTIGGFVVNIDGDGPIYAGLVSGVAYVTSGQMVGATDDPSWGETAQRQGDHEGYRGSPHNSVECAISGCA